MMASVFGGAKLTPVLRTPEANPFADIEPMGKYQRSALAGRLYLTTHRAQHCFPRRSFPVMISLLNLYGYFLYLICMESTQEKGQRVQRSGAALLL